MGNEQERIKTLEDALHKCLGVLVLGGNDMWATARENRKNLDGHDIAFPDEPPDTSAIGTTVIQKCAIDRTFQIWEEFVGVYDEVYNLLHAETRRNASTIGHPDTSDDTIEVTK